MNRSKTYYRVRTVVRIIFWTTFIVGGWALACSFAPSVLG
jgi:hypothetical protein